MHVATPETNLATVVFERPNGSRVALHPGDVIGRAAHAALLVDNPSVSEAHAMVSLRRGKLCLLALRRRIAVNGRSEPIVELVVGTEVRFAQDYALRTCAVRLPTAALTLGSPPTVPVRRLGSVASVFGHPRPRIVSRFDPEAAAHVWRVGEEWRVRLGSEAPMPVNAQSSFMVDDLRFDFGEEPLGVGAVSTAQEGGIAPPLRIVTHYDAVEIHRGADQVTVISGVGARILTELGAFGTAIEWLIVAREVWRDEPELSEATLRRRWDVGLVRLRKRLEAEGISAGLVRSDGHGLVQLILRTQDRLECRE
ncbi:MAG: FHA domain-containing protein [Sandaracinaceae bacterium]